MNQLPQPAGFRQDVQCGSAFIEQPNRCQMWEVRKVITGLLHGILGCRGVFGGFLLRDVLNMRTEF